MIFVCSIGVYTGLFSAGPFSLVAQDLFKFPPAIHRLVTVYLLTMPKLGMLFDTYFIYSYMSQLEKSNAKFARKEDLIWYLMVVTTVATVGVFPSTISPRLVSCPSQTREPSYIHTKTPQHICPLSESSSTAKAVPGIEEEYPRISAGPSFAYLFRASWDAGMVGCLYG